MKNSAGVGLRAAGWVGGRVRTSILGKKVQAELATFQGATEIEGRLALLGEAEAEQIRIFIESPEVQHALLGIATERGLRLCGKKSEKASG